MQPPDQCPPEPSTRDEEEKHVESIEEELRHPERTLLAGPRGRCSELATLARVVWDFLKAFRALHFAGPAVTIFGSARTKPGTTYYEMARQMGSEIAKLGFTVITGGGPGIMEAGNRGAHEAGGRSIGINIDLPFEQHENPYLDRSVNMYYFFTRKVILVKYSYAFVVLPGGAGTLDEMFETITLIQTKKIHNFPIILMGKDYWQPLMDFVYKMAESGTISPEDPELIFFTDSVEEAIAHLKRHAVRQFGLRKKRLPRARTILGESSLTTKSSNPA